MTWARPAVLAAAAVVLAAASVAASALAGARTVHVEAGQPVGEVAARHAGGVLVLGAGRHPPFTLDVGVTVRGGPGAVVTGPVNITADGVRVEGVAVRNGPEGIVVRRADGVVLDGVSVHQARRHGIEVVEGSARIVGCDVGGLVDPYAQGIEVRNTNGRARTVVESCRVEGGREGIVAHVSRVEFRGNEVTGTHLRGISVTEMSEGLVEHNVVSDVTGMALHCGDMSNCVFRWNHVSDVASDGSGVRSHGGHGAVGDFYARMQLVDNRVARVAGGPTFVVSGASVTAVNPLEVWPAGWRGVLPALPIGVASIVGIGVLRLLAGEVLRRRSPPGRGGRPAGVGRGGRPAGVGRGGRPAGVGRGGRPAGVGRGGRPAGVGSGYGRAALAAAASAFAVQTFHMFEHAVQVWQVYAVEGENRSGLVGAHADAEWIHLAFNATLLVFLALMWRGGVADVAATRRGRPAAAWLVAAIAAQGYHTAEHVAKVSQHVTSGLKTAPGLLGDDLGLVWFHYGINLAVYAATVLAGAHLLRVLRAADGAPLLTGAAAGAAGGGPDAAEQQALVGARGRLLE